MQLTILGSGTLNSAHNRNPAGYLINADQKLALLDCGPGILKQLCSINISVMDIENIFLSHFHLDHCADVFPLLLKRYLLDKKANRALKIVGPQGLKHWYNTLAGLQGSWLHESPPQLHELDNSPVTWTNLQFDSIQTRHSESSVAYRISAEKSFFYSGDTGYFEPLIDFAKNVDYGLIECSMPDTQPCEGHLTRSECARLAQKAEIKVLIATHIYAQNDTADFARDLEKNFSGEVIIARDFMEFEI